jgi:hypothetical protein
VSANEYASWMVGIDPGRARAEHGRRGSPVPGSRVTTDPVLLRQLYVVEGLSARDIATKLGCAGATILRRLRRLGVNVPPTGPVPYSRARVLSIDWSPESAYALGLMATDGNLGRRKGQLSLVSKDLDQIETLRRCLRLEAKISRVRSSTGFLHKVQWHDRGLYDWFLSVGLTPAKSRTPGPLTVPDKHADFFRGCIDGDRCVLGYTDRYHATKSPSYVYERLYVSLVSANRPFLEWIRASTRRLVGVSGAVHNSGGKRQRPIWALRYAKRESLRLLGWMYYDPAVPCVARQRLKAEGFLSVVHCPRQRQGPGWCNGSHAGLKIQCPQGRAGSTPAPGTIP